MLELQNLIRAFNGARICMVDSDPSRCVHRAPFLATSQTQQLHNHINRGDHHSTAGLHLAGMADVKRVQ